MNEVITGIIIGVCSAGTTAFIVWIYTLYRDLRLRSKIKKMFNNPGTSTSIDGLGIVLNNQSHIPIIIRNVSVRLSAIKGHPQRPVGGECGTFKLNYNSHHNFGGQKDLKLYDEERGFVELPPYTNGEWIILWKTLNDKYLEFVEFKGTEITVEYLTLLKIPKILTIEDNKPSSAAYYFNNSRKRDTEGENRVSIH